MIGIHAISIHDATNVYQFDGSIIEPSTDPYTKKPITRDNGRVLQYEHTLSFNHNSAELHASLLDDANVDNRNWKASIAYFDGFLVWDSAWYIELSERTTSDPSAGLYPYKVSMRSRASYLKVGLAKNLVRAWQLSQNNALFADSDSNNIADGFTNAGFGSLVYNNTFNNQTVVWQSGTDQFYIDVVFPISGITLTGGYDFTTADSDGSVRIEDRDIANNLGTNSTTSLTGTGVEKVTITTATDAYKIRLIVQATGTASLTFDNPFITYDGSFINA